MPNDMIATAMTRAHLRATKARLRRDMPGDAHTIARRRLHLYSYVSGKGWTPHSPAVAVEFDYGALYVGGVRVVNPHIGADHISWRQCARDALGTHYTAGHLHLHSNGVEAHGTVAVGTSHADAVAHSVFATVVPTLNYTTRITKVPYPVGTKPSNVPVDGWQAGLALAIGYQQQIGSSVPSPVVSLDGQDISVQSTWSVDGDNTVLEIALSDSDCQFAPSLYSAAKIAFDALQINAVGHGAITGLCSSAQTSSQAWLWEATPQTSLAAPPAMRREFAPPHLLSVANDPLTVNELMTILPDDVVNDDANSMLMRNMKWAMGQSGKEKDWLTKFFGETPPVITEPDQIVLVNKSLSWYQDKFAMAYMTQSFNSYDGPNAPSHRLDTTQATNLSEFLKSGLAADKDFNVQHQGIYVDAYIGTKPRLAAYVSDTTAEYVGWAQGSVIFGGAAPKADIDIPPGTTVRTAVGIVYTTQARATLKAGATLTDAVPVAAQDPGQASVVAAASLVQFGTDQPAGISTVTNAAATTLDADSGGMKWAKILFTTLTSGSQFILMVNRVAGAAGDPKALGPVNNFACLLTALDRSGTVATNYFQSVLSGVLIKMVPQVVHRDSATIMQWLPAAMQELFRKLANGELPNMTDISKTEALEMYQEYLKNSADISLATADLLQAIVASGLIKQASAAEEQFATTIAQRWPKLAKASRFMLAFGWIGAVSSVIVSLVRGDWSKMTDVERAEFVTNIVQLTVTGFDAVPLIWQGTKYVTLSIWNKLNEWWNKPQVQDEIEMERLGIADENTPLIEQEASNINELMEASGGGRILGEGTIFERIFAEGVFTGVLKCIGALAAAAMAGYSLWQLIEDIKNHGSVSTIVFDSLIFAANLLAAVCLVADLFIATSFIPIAGAILAIVGIILGVLAGFFVKPDNPVDDWMVDNGIPFAKALPAPKQLADGSAIPRLKLA